MTLTRRQLFATLAAAIAAPFVPTPPVVWKERLWTSGFVTAGGATQGPPVNSDAFVAFYRTNLQLAVDHPAQGGWITNIDGNTFNQAGH